MSGSLLVASPERRKGRSPDHSAPERLLAKLVNQPGQQEGRAFEAKRSPHQPAPLPAWRLERATDQRSKHRSRLRFGRGQGL